MVISRTPFRVSFFGGGTDYPAWWRENGGSVIGGTINQYCWINVRVLPPFFSHRHRAVYSVVENFSNLEEVHHPSVRETLRYLGIHDRTGLSIHHDGDLPARSGMGSSSAFTVGLVHALTALEGRRLSKEELTRTAIHIEQNLIKENVGSQDQTFAAHGGLQRIRFHPNGAIEVDPVVLAAEHLQALEGHLLLLFTGLSREANKVAGEQLRTMGQKQAEMRRMLEIVDEADRLFSRGLSALDDFGRLLHEAWQLKRGLSTQISNAELDGAYEAARRQGALGGKLLGAGGGGFMLLYAAPERHPDILRALPGYVHVPFHFEFSGSDIVFYRPDEVLPQGRPSR